MFKINNRSLSDCNWTRTQNHLARKRTLNHLAKLASLAKLLSVRLQTNSGSGFLVQLQSLKLQISRLLPARISLTFRQHITHYTSTHYRIHSETRTWYDKNIQSFNKRSTRKRCDMCSKLTIMTPERRQWRRSGVFILYFEHISHLVLVFLL